MKRVFQTLLLLAFTALLTPMPEGYALTPFILLSAAVALSIVASVLPARSPITGQYNGVNVEIWVKYIIEKFWKKNKFLQFAFNDDQYVVGGTILHIPQPGANPTVVKNRTVYPATAVQRADTDITFALDTYTTDPTHITEADKVELSYDKMDNVMGDHLDVLNETVANDTIIKWMANTLPAGNIVKTTGGAAAATTTGQTGNRKVMKHADLKAAQLIMNIQNVPSEDRYALLDANMLDQLLTDLSNTQYRDFSQYVNAETGIIGKLWGFNIVDRSSTALFTSGDVVSPFGSAVAADDNVASICWQKNSVTRAIGEVKTFENPDRAEYYGDIISALLRAAARRRRADNKGVVAIVAAP